MAALSTSLSSLAFTSPTVSYAAHGSHAQVGAVRVVVRGSHSAGVLCTRRCFWDVAVRRRVSSWPCGARRKESGATKTQQEVLDDEDLRAGLNETVTEALKVMLAEDDKMLETFKDKVDFLGEFLVQDGQMEAARFMLILRGMLDHEVYPQYEELEEPYKKAFNTLWCLLEDSGWLLKQPGAEILEVEEEPEEPELEIRFS
ncbi:hypothetical protein M758_8G070700 [Ceratodon purpureus]|uniref:Uncharacterized protein n=1 Tax=Ceratodon purpureus TaxID=3225 RepID=A0A8T0GWF3_CERPU|nr:hypothetical protein KC19_N017900 [Ceratodon purpureus]KAG0564006.1 hypothetical protein KC19_8G075500 [Ceratodon purpureus]KAG0608005.1 hypothetical protein M758_8G070700 [Ceratodon purpureus]